MRPGEALALELRFLIEAGLAPHEALRAATGTAGEFVNAHATDRQRFGELVPGARADLLLLSADPLQDVSRAFAPVGVMAAGRWYSELDLRSLRAEAAAVVPKYRRRRARAALRTDRSKPERRCLRPAAS
jgi:adenine deaminase